MFATRKMPGPEFFERALVASRQCYEGWRVRSDERNDALRIEQLDLERSSGFLQFALKEKIVGRPHEHAV